MIKLKYLFMSLLFLVYSAATFAQSDKQTGIGEVMRSNGRIYVVMAVVLTILTGLILYIIRLDRKISKLEKE